MGLEVPPWVAEMFHVLTGDGWPAADESEITDLAQLWFTIGADLMRFAPEVTQSARSLADSGALVGDSRRAITQTVAVVTGDGTLTLEKLAAGFEEMGQYLHEVALQVQYMKIIVIEELILLAGQIAYLIAMMPWTFGASAAGIATLQVFGRAFAMALMRQLVVAIAIGEVLQVGLDAIAQLAQIANGWRKSGEWGWNLTTSAAITGAVGGVLGPVFEGLGHVPAHWLGKTIGHDLAEISANVVKGAGHEYITDGASGLVQNGQWSPDTFSLTAGAADEGITAVAGNGRRSRAARGAANLKVPGVDAFPSPLLALPDRTGPAAIATSAPATIATSAPATVPQAAAWRDTERTTSTPPPTSPTPDHPWTSSLPPGTGRELLPAGTNSASGPSALTSLPSTTSATPSTRSTPSTTSATPSTPSMPSTIWIRRALTPTPPSHHHVYTPPDTQTVHVMHPGEPSPTHHTQTVQTDTDDTNQAQTIPAPPPPHPPPTETVQTSAITPVSFRSLPEALRFMETEIDRPASSRVADLGNGFELHVSSRTFSDGGFTNVYDLSWNPSDATATVHVNSRPVKAIEQAQGALAITSAAFFVLMDETSGLPAQTSLNFVIDQGRILSLPVIDREALLCRDGTLSTDHISAEGQLVINGTELTWAGSRTGRTAQSYVYGNGNIVIPRRKDPTKGSVRFLDEASRRTPSLSAGDQLVDVGFIATDDGGFRSTAIAAEGGMDIFAYDIVVRCPAQHIDPQGDNRMGITRIGSLSGDALPDFAVTVGPSLNTSDFTAHPINRDLSLGDSPPFVDQRKAQLVLYHDLEGRTHLRLFDGRPGAPLFQGATPTEARDTIAADTGYQWGSFLDGGQTAKMWVIENGTMTSYGNRHYLRWPKHDADDFVWVPDSGRPTPSFITFQPKHSASLSLPYDDNRPARVLAVGRTEAQPPA